MPAKTSRTPVKTATTGAVGAPRRRPASPTKTGKSAKATKATQVAPPPASTTAPAPSNAGAAAKAAKTRKAAKPAKPRPKLVRDSFTMPAADFALIDAMKARALGARRAAKKSELLRAGLHALATLDAPALVDALDRLEPVQTGRPKKAR